VVVSIVDLIAVGASGAALWIAFRLRRHMPRVHQLRFGAALVMGGAVAAMHYTGMAAARFPIGSVCGAAGGRLQGNTLALPILVITICVLAVALITSVLDMRLEMRTAVLADALGVANEELEFLALHDKLTHLPNRVLLEDRFTLAIQAAARHHGRFAVLFVDLDGFKGVNDTYGHQVGDGLLVEIASRLRASVSSEDTIARVGGDEFVLLVHVDEPEDAGVVAGKLIDVLREPAMWQATCCTSQAASASRSTRRRTGSGRVDDQCRRRDVPREGIRPERKLLLRAVDEPSGAGAADADPGLARGPEKRPIAVALSAEVFGC
jgi:diguanylate cyclase (GGDEF)-like protein